MARAKRREEQPNEGSGSHTFDDSVIGPSCPLSFCGKIERMASHVHAVAAEGHALRLEPHALLQTRMPRQPDVSSGAQHPMPGDAVLGLVQGPGDRSEEHTSELQS